MRTAMTRTFILFCLLTFGCENIYSQKDTTAVKKNWIKKVITKYDIHIIPKADILLPIISHFDNRSSYAVTAEICLLNRYSLEGTGMNSFYTGSDKKESSFQIIYDAKYYISKKKHYTGFYTGPYVKFKSFDSSYGTRPTSTKDTTYLEYYQTSFGAGIICGYQIYIKKRIVIELITSFGFLYSEEPYIKNEINTKFDDYKQTVPDYRIGLNIGYKF